MDKTKNALRNENSWMPASIKISGLIKLSATFMFFSAPM